MFGAMSRVVTSGPPRAYNQPISPSLLLEGCLLREDFPRATNSCDYPQAAFKEAAVRRQQPVREASRPAKGTVPYALRQILWKPASKRVRAEEGAFLQQKRQKIQKQVDEDFEDKYVEFERKQREQPYRGHKEPMVKDIPDPPSSIQNDDDTLVFHSQSAAGFQQQALIETPSQEKDISLGAVAKRFKVTKLHLHNNRGQMYKVSKQYYKARTHQNRVTEAFPHHGNFISHVRHQWEQVRKEILDIQDEHVGIYEGWLNSDEQEKDFPRFRKLISNHHHLSKKLEWNRAKEQQCRFKVQKAAQEKKSLGKRVGRLYGERGRLIVRMHADETFLARNGKAIGPLWMRPPYKHSPLRACETTSTQSSEEQSSPCNIQQPLAPRKSMFFAAPSKSWLRPKYQASASREGQRVSSLVPKKQHSRRNVLEGLTSRDSAFFQDASTSAWSVKRDSELPPVFFD